MSIYYSPEDFGMKMIDEFDLSSRSYEFDLVVVWQSLTDKRALYIGADSGCSCPTPFEDVRGVEDLERLDPDNPLPQIETMFQFNSINYSHTTAELLKGVSEMVLEVKEVQR